jgi:hypothetical protein
LNPGFTGETVPVKFEGVTFQVDASAPERPAWFVLGVRKSGSSMFNRAVKLLAKFNAVNWVDIAGDLFENNVPAPRWSPLTPPEGLIVGGNCYGGFRDLPGGLTRDAVFQAARKVLLVRDPRDAIVSEYFSTRGTHSLPKFSGEGDDGAREDLLRRREALQQVTVEDFARREGQRMAETVERYIPLIGDPRLLVLKYEDVIFDKARMVRNVATHFGWKVGQGQVDAILKWIDVMPEQENPDAFIRKVTPGDHLEKLSGGTIAELDRVLARAMGAFGYR